MADNTEHTNRSYTMNKLIVLLVAVLLVQSALASKEKGRKNKKDSSSSSESNEKKKHHKSTLKCPACPPREVLVIREVTACDLDQKHLTCPAGTTIRIHEAFYGRKNSSTCRYLEDGKDINRTCSAPNALEIVKRRCTGKTVCDLANCKTWFSDPCSNVYKYLQVSFSCSKA